MGIKTTREVNVYTTDRKGTVTAEWPGGAYVDLGFGGHRPTEVINVYNYETGETDPRVHTPSGLREIVREWIKTNDEEWPEWYATHLENASYYV